MAARFGLVLDCSDPEALAQFWSQALGYTIVGGVGAYVLLSDPDKAMPNLLLQGVPEDKAARNRMHLDIVVDDIELEVKRLEALGAHRLDDGHQHFGDTKWIRMSDPEHNEFCVCTGVEW